MHLDSITLRGFKSFPDRTRLTFSPGVSVIVGPNGSGKSNITDAVLWALGEQSPVAVRGASMQDVIFAGAHGVKSRSEAEVEVVLDNASGRLDLPVGEVAITRRLNRAGDGEYRIERRQVPAHGRDRDPLGHRPGQGDALRRLSGPRGRDRHVQAQGPADADRRGRRPWQAPQAPPQGAVEAGAHAGQPGPSVGRGARGAHAAEAPEAPGRGGGVARAHRAPERRGTLDAGPRQRPHGAFRAGGSREDRGGGPRRGRGRRAGVRGRPRSSPEGRGEAVLAWQRRDAVLALLLREVERRTDRHAPGRRAAHLRRAGRARETPRGRHRRAPGRDRGRHRRRRHRGARRRAPEGSPSWPRTTACGWNAHWRERGPPRGRHPGRGREDRAGPGRRGASLPGRSRRRGCPPCPPRAGRRRREGPPRVRADRRRPPRSTSSCAPTLAPRAVRGARRHPVRRAGLRAGAVGRARPPPACGRRAGPRSGARSSCPRAARTAQPR